MEIITENSQDVQMFINDQHGQLIIITVVVEGAASQHLKSKCQLAFHSQVFRVRDSRCGQERESKTAGPGQGSTSSEQVRVHSHKQNSCNWSSSTTRWTGDSKESSGQVVPEAWSQGSGPLGGEGERELEGAYLNSHRTPDKTGELHQI